MRADETRASRLADRALSVVMEMDDVLDARSGAPAEGSRRAFEDAALQLCVLEYRLDDEIAVRVGVEPVDRERLRARRLGRLGRPEASGDAAVDARPAAARSRGRQTSRV